MRTVFTIIVTVALYPLTLMAADPQIVWQIGKADRTYKDLAFNGDIAAYGKHFAQDVNFVIGKSDPAKDFSGIHPGPTDAWAGNRLHAFTITFDLPEEAAGAYELRLDLIDTHASVPPALRVQVNDATAEIKLPTGTGDIALLRPETGKARPVRFCFDGKTLKKTGNRVTITNTAGSWLLYDAVTFFQLPAGAIELQAEPTIFFVEKDGRLRQEFNIQAFGVLSDQPLQIEVKAGDAVVGTCPLGKPSLGIVGGPIYIDAADAPRDLTLRLAAGSAVGTAAVRQAPRKMWKIYVAPATHTDIGYTERQEHVIDVHNRNTDLAIELSHEFPAFHWNLESSWAAQVWFRNNPPYRHAELLEAARRRRVGIEASYLNMLTGLCSEEELIRQMYYSIRLNREHGVPFESYTLTDAPSHVWSLPSILAGAGIRCISIGSNQTRAPILKQNLHHKAPFRWEGPDGQHVLTWITESYAQARLIGLSEGLQGMRQAIQGTMLWWDQRKDYPYDAILLHGAYFDNVSIGRNIAENLAEYNKHYAYPKVILCANNQFFEYVEKNFADKIPTVRGCGGSWWEDGAASTAWETAVCRRTHQDIIAAETAWAIASAGNANAVVPQEQLNTIWDKILLYDEHTWGAYNSISEPALDFVHRQWAYKAQFATDADFMTRRLLDEGLRTIASHVKAADGALLVFNPSGATRSGNVEAVIPRNCVILDDKGIVPQQIVSEDQLLNRTVAFRAVDVPPVGYRTYRVEPAGGAEPTTPSRFNNNVLENEYYKIALDLKAGAISSIIDKKLNRELVDAKSPYKFGQLVYAAGGDDPPGTTQVECPNVAKVVYSTNKDGSVTHKAGPLTTEVRLASKHDMFQNIRQYIILYEQERRVDFVCKINKKHTYAKEAVYFAFPFAGDNPKFRYEIGGGNVRPNEDHVPGACRDWFAVQRWVTVNSDGAAVAWSPLDTPLITLCDTTPGKWLDTLPLTNGTVFAYAMNNYWCTNYKASQDGEMVFRFSLTSDTTIDPAAASVFGEQAQMPMRSIRLHAGRTGQNLPPTASLCRVEPASVQLTAFKPADDGKGLIVRLRETGGQATDAKLSIGIPGVNKASRCDLVERVQVSIPLADGKLTAALKANGMTTIRLETEQ